MDTLLIRERYKVTHVLWAEDSYAALEAVDIESRENLTYLLNVYEGGYLKPYLACYTNLRHCPAFRGMFVEDGSLVAVFQQQSGAGIDQVFYKGTKMGWEKRLSYAELLFHLALSMTDFPPKVSCASMLSENLLILPDEGTLTANPVIRPLKGASERELIFLTTDQIQKVLTPRFSSLVPEREFVREISDGSYTSVVALYSRWLDAKAELTEAYTALYEKMAFGRVMWLLWMNIKYWLKTKLKRKKR